MKRRNFKYIVCACVLVYLYHILGVSDYINAKDFDDDFNYPLNVDIKSIVNDVLKGEKVAVKPINYYPYKFLSNSGICSTANNLDLFIAVKSAMDHFELRDAIRQTYVHSHIPGRTIKSLFFLGVDGKPKSDVQKRIDQEMAEHKDIIQIDFMDSYFNNTIKTMMIFRWMFEHCSSAEYYLVTDDDIYISVNNLLSYINHREAVGTSGSTPIAASDEYAGGTVSEDEALFMGYVFNSTPQRFISSKWRVSLDEYRWNRWPTYVTAMAYVVSNKAMKVMYVASLFVKHFRFDDIYLAIVAKKVGIEPVHCPEFHFYKKKFSVSSYKDVIASHGYSDPEELIRVWRQMNNLQVV